MTEPCKWPARAGPPCTCPQPLRHASAWKAAAAPHGGARAAAHALRRARLRRRRHRPRLHLTRSLARPACSAGAGRQPSQECLPRQQLTAVCALEAASCKASASAPGLPEHSLLDRARGRCRRCSRPHMHLDSCCGGRLPPPSAARPCRLCAPRQVCPEPISMATLRPHGRRAAAAQGSLCARDRRTRCMPGLSPTRARRAGRMPAPLCAQHPNAARPPRRRRCARARRAPTWAPPHGVQRSAPTRRALPEPPAAHPAAPHPMPA